MGYSGYRGRIAHVLKQAGLGVGGLLLATVVQAQAGVDAKIADSILSKLRESRADISYGPVLASPIAGLYQVQVENGPVLYVSADGTHFVAGDLFRVEPGEFVNLQERGREQQRVELLRAVPLQEQIVFAPKGELKAFVSVFTDIDCGFCRKLHQEVPALNAMGIEVRYLAYPRAGIPSASYNKIATAWCAQDPKAALTKLKNGESVPTNVCAGNPVAKQTELALSMGVRGTPAIVTPAGVLLPGYMPAAQLAEALGVK